MSNDSEQVTQQQVAQEITAGTAEPLQGGVPGPVLRAGRWWAVSAGATEPVYTPVTNPNVIDQLDQDIGKVRAAQEATADPGSGS